MTNEELIAKIKAEIERLKAEGKFTPSWGPKFNFKNGDKK